MLFDIVKLLDEKDPTRLPVLAQNDFSISSHKKHAHISYDDTKQRWPWEIRDGIFMEANLSAASIMRFIDLLITEYGEERSSFYVSVVAEEPAEEEEDE